MRLLCLSTLRHLRQHIVQTCFTLAAAALFTALFTALFCFTAALQVRLRESGVEAKGGYHYQYYTQADSDSAVMLQWMAEEFGQDAWFSDVVLMEDGEELRLFLTVASPGIFTSMQMKERLRVFEERYHAAFSSVLISGHDHNYDILVSYGVLERESGIYAFLLIFLMAFSLIAVTAILTLAAVFGVSAAQREKDFALFASVGADGRQIRGIMLIESGFYIGASIPAGFLLGILLFLAGKARFDALIYALDRYPPVRLVISAPSFILLAASASCVILGAGLAAAGRAAAVSPMALLAGAADISLSGEAAAALQDSGQRRGIFGRVRRRLSLYGRLGVEAFLAWRSCRRFRRRFRPILLVLSATFALCFVLTGIRVFSLQAVEMSGSGLDYNISVQLQSDNLETLNRLAEKLAASSGYELEAVRTARFELHLPVPLSAEAEATGFPSRQGILPDILLVSAQREIWEKVCGENGIAMDPAGGAQGIFIHADRQWRDEDGVLIRGKPFGVKAGDRIPVYGSRETDAAAAAEILIAGVAEDAPLYLNTEPASRMIVMVPEEVFLELETLCPKTDLEPGMRRISLRGLCADPFEMEKMCREQIEAQGIVTGSVVNCEEELQRDWASVAGFQALCGALIVLLAAAAVCGNFTVSWAVDTARKKEYAVLSGIGMKPEEMRRMRYWELSLQTVAAAVAGLPAGILCYYAIYKIYSTEYGLQWQLPWQGLAMGLAVLLVQILAIALVFSRCCDYNNIGK